MSPGRVVIADDDVLLREGVATLLERSGFEILGRAGDGSQLVSQVRALKPDLVVVDIRMPPTNTTEGLDAARVIRDEFPETGILVLSAHVEVKHAGCTRRSTSARSHSSPSSRQRPFRSGGEGNIVRTAAPQIRQCGCISAAGFLPPPF
jgi:DNA-binding NarL/FixJ family response regulator